MDLGRRMAGTLSDREGAGAAAGLASPARRKPHNFHAHVMYTLGTAIVGGTYKEGQILPGDSDLIDQFGVSRTVLREALKTLSGSRRHPRPPAGPLEHVRFRRAALASGFRHLL